MENSSIEPVQDKKMNGSKNEEVNSNVKGVPKEGIGYVYPPKEEASGHLNPAAEVNMESTITSEDVIRAGGFGARDDLGSFLPVASDATDFEETLLDARDYEEPRAEGESRRPGLGWNDAAGGT